jgi:uncharacterized LabA/DUF88 family protein
MFVDGENLVVRFQKMLEAGKTKAPDVVHIKDRFVWHPETAFYANYEVQRVSYYTSSSGDQCAIDSLWDEIQNAVYHWQSESGHLIAPVTPKVFHKKTKEEKSRHIDIAITLDVLVATFTHNLDAVILVSGDRDYIPLVKEVARRGKRVEVFGLSSGFNPELRRAADSANELDHLYFENASSRRGVISG